MNATKVLPLLIAVAFILVGVAINWGSHRQAPSRSREPTEQEIERDRQRLTTVMNDVPKAILDDDDISAFTREELIDALFYAGNERLRKIQRPPRDIFDPPILELESEFPVGDRMEVVKQLQLILEEDIFNIDLFSRDQISDALYVHFTGELP